MSRGGGACATRLDVGGAVCATMGRKFLRKCCHVRNDVTSREPVCVVEKSNTIIHRDLFCAYPNHHSFIKLSHANSTHVASCYLSKCARHDDSHPRVNATFADRHLPNQPPPNLRRKRRKRTPLPQPQPIAPRHQHQHLSPPTCHHHHPRLLHPLPLWDLPLAPPSGKTRARRNLGRRPGRASAPVRPPRRWRELR